MQDFTSNNLMSYLETLGLSREQRDDLCEHIFRNIEAAQNDGYRSGQSDYAYNMLRYLDYARDRLGVNTDREKARAAVERICTMERAGRSPEVTGAIKATYDYLKRLRLGRKTDAHIALLMDNMLKTLAEDQFLRGVSVGMSPEGKAATSMAPRGQDVEKC